MKQRKARMIGETSGAHYELLKRLERERKRKSLILATPPRFWLRLWYKLCRAFGLSRS